MDITALAIVVSFALVVMAGLWIDSKLHPACKRVQLGYNCRRSYKQRCEGCQPVENHHGA